MKSLDKSLERMAKELSAPRSIAGERRESPEKETSPAAEHPVTPSAPSHQDEKRSAPKSDSPPDKEQADPGTRAELSEKEVSSLSASETFEEGTVDPRLICLLAPRSEHAESYYRLRYGLETRRRDDSALVVGVTSPGKGDGKTLTGINLAGALAKDARTRVLLLDLNFRGNGAEMSTYLGMSSQSSPGIVDWIRETGHSEGQLTHYLQRFNLHVMAAGSEPELPYELLKSSRLDALIAHARDEYDFVVIDMPQILRLPDTELISRLVDGFLIVVKADRTRQGELEEALNLMTEEKVFGLVFNAVSNNQ